MTDEDNKVGILRTVTWECTDFLRTVIVYVCPYCDFFRSKASSGGSLNSTDETVKRRDSAIRGALRDGQYDSEEVGYTRSKRLAGRKTCGSAKHRHNSWECTIIGQALWSSSRACRRKRTSSMSSTMRLKRTAEGRWDRLWYSLSRPTITRRWSRQSCGTSTAMKEMTDSKLDKETYPQSTIREGPDQSLSESRNECHRKYSSTSQGSMKSGTIRFRSTRIEVLRDRIVIKVHSTRRWRRWTSRKLENERTQLDEKTDEDQKCFVERSQERIYGRDPLGHHSGETLWKRPYGRDHSTETIRETIRERPCGRTRRETTTGDHSGDHTGYHDWRLQESTENGFWDRPDAH